MDFLYNNMPVITTLIAAVYAFALWYWLRRVKKTISVSATRWLIGLHLALLALLLLLAYLSDEYQVSPRGLWATRLLIWLFLLTGIAAYTVGHKSQFNIITRIYFFTFSLLPTLAGIFLLIPFVGVVILFSLLGRLSGTSDTVLYNDKQVRVQTTFLGILGPPPLDIYKKNGLFEKRAYRAYGFWNGGIDSVKTVTDKSSTTITIYHDSTKNDIASPLIVSVPNDL